LLFTIVAFSGIFYMSEKRVKVLMAVALTPQEILGTRVPVKEFRLTTSTGDAAYSAAMKRWAEFKLPILLIRAPDAMPEYRYIGTVDGQDVCLFLESWILPISEIEVSEDDSSLLAIDKVAKPFTDLLGSLSAFRAIMEKLIPVKKADDPKPSLN
jgi:hypothetical protein